MSTWKNEMANITLSTISCQLLDSLVSLLLGKQKNWFFLVSETFYNLFFNPRYLFRLYWFPLKILYTSSVVSTHADSNRGVCFYFFYNCLIWFLMFLNIYWFSVSGYFSSYIIQIFSAQAVIICFKKLIFQSSS